MSAIEPIVCAPGLNDPVIPGLAMCCNRHPIFDRNGFKCPTCGLHKRGIGGGIEWFGGLWNKHFHKTSWNIHGEHWSQKTLTYHPAPMLDLPEWKFAELEYSLHLPWSERKTQKNDFASFLAPGRSDESLLVSKDGYECVIDKSRCLDRIRLRTITGNEIDIKIPPFKKMPGVQVFITRGWCTDDTWWYTIHITTYNHKWHSKMSEALGGVPEFNQLTLQ